jgi:hypothetical protein
VGQEPLTKLCLQASNPVDESDLYH